jgi:5-methylthioribose kinase
MHMLDIEDLGQLLAYLRGHGHLAPEETPVLMRLAGGVSNRTVLVRRPRGESWVLKQALAKLRVDMDWFASPDRVHREALALRWLARLAPEGTVVPLVFEDHEHHLLAMQAVPEPHHNWKAMLLAGRVVPGHFRQFGALLGTIHRRGQEAGLELRTAFEDRSFFESLRLEPYYRTAAERNPGAAAFLQQVMAETRARRVTLVHGDYSPKNILVHAERLVLLDHEVAHCGDPAFDLGFALTHFLSKSHHVHGCGNAFLDGASLFWDSYRETAGQLAVQDETPARAVRHALACLLARVDGRSPLEYLTPAERDRQRDFVLRLMTHPAESPPALVSQFSRLVNL